MVDDNIVFIDASGEGHYEKVGNQNALRNEDVELIVETFINGITGKYAEVE